MYFVAFVVKCLANSFTTPRFRGEKLRTYTHHRDTEGAEFGRFVIENSCLGELRASAVNNSKLHVRYQRHF